MGELESSWANQDVIFTHEINMFNIFISLFNKLSHFYFLNSSLHQNKNKKWVNKNKIKFVYLFDKAEFFSASPRK